MAADFEKQSYWHDRFTSETAFEWLAPSTAFIPFIEPYLNSSGNQKILHLGSGTSDLHVRLREKGHNDVTNVDYEPLALARGREMEERFFGDVGMKYVVADVTELDLPADLLIHDGFNGFDIVLDKGTVDAAACAGDEATSAMARWVRKCLKDGGVWISLSYSAGRFEIKELPFDSGKLGSPNPETREKGNRDVKFLGAFPLGPGMSQHRAQDIDFFRIGLVSTVGFVALCNSSIRRPAF
ncbi:hypothetical protein RRF57_008579 [Xylaria bambusicola]|uniref:Methyltransferase domain-containing protein n=1 Tax=Xylaria bambusicola TaxID=326684 RepID=A0AAN7UI32_9PEZI